MRIHGRWLIGFWLLCFGSFLPAAHAQPGGTVRGRVTLEQSGDPLHKARVLIVQLGRATETDESGAYEFTQVPPGSYDVVVQRIALTDERRTVQVSSGGTFTLDFHLRLATLRQQVTVTASGREETPFDTFQAVSTIDSLQLVERVQPSLGDVLEGQPGVAKRSFGPGTGRPVIRGFDGDRVLIMKDGISTSTLSSQSGDHGELVDPLNLERLEIVKGPATLLYGSSAIGGVVNAISAHGQMHEHPHAGWSGYATGLGGTANSLGSGGGGVEYGHRNWLLWADGGGLRAGNYDTPLGEIPNSRTRLGNATAGFGNYREKSFFSGSFGYENGRYGIPPIDETVQLALRRYNGRFNGGFRNLGHFVDGFRLTLDYSDYEHKELEIESDGTETLGTLFNNKILSYRGVFDQKRTGSLSGSFGFSGLTRDYKTSGAEAIAPPVDLNNFAFFTLQEISFERFRLQFGGRVDRTSYAVSGTLPDRSFTGFSGAAGIHVPLGKGWAFVANYTHSYRAPALEELYNNGAHPGNATFEIGNPALRGERSDGADFSIRQQASRVRGEVNFFYYGIGNFVFLAPTGNITDDLIEAEYLQSDSRFWGSEASLDVGLQRNLWLNLGLDYVNAELTSPVTTQTTGLVTPSGTALPRIPPLRGRVGFDFRWRGLSVRPETVMARDQERLFVTETRTPGYAVFNLNASYTIARQHLIQVFSVSAFNLGDRLYFNHLSFIKAFAPEIGRGARFGYTVRFF